MPVVLQAVCVNLLRALVNRAPYGQSLRVLFLHHKLEFRSNHLYLRNARLRIFYWLELG